MRRRVTSSLQRANSSRDNRTRRSITTRIPRAIGDTPWHPSIVVRALDTPERFGDDGDGDGDGGARCRCSFAVYTTLRSPDGTSTERLTRQWTTPLHSRGRTIPMLTAFHAKCRGSRRLQSVERPWLDSQTRHTYTYPLHALTTTRERESGLWSARIYLRSWLWTTTRADQEAGTKNHFRSSILPLPVAGDGATVDKEFDFSPILDFANRVTKKFAAAENHTRIFTIHLHYLAILVRN